MNYIFDFHVCSIVCLCASVKMLDSNQETLSWVPVSSRGLTLTQPLFHTPIVILEDMGRVQDELACTLKEKLWTRCIKNKYILFLQCIMHHAQVQQTPLQEVSPLKSSNMATLQFNTLHGNHTSRQYKEWDLL